MRIKPCELLPLIPTLGFYILFIYTSKKPLFGVNCQTFELKSELRHDNPTRFETASKNQKRRYRKE